MRLLLLGAVSTALAISSAVAAQPAVCNSFSEYQQVFVDSNPCTEFRGDVSIVGPQITNLDGFRRVTRIDGILRITGTNITDLSALENLERLGGLNLQNNPNLTTLSGILPETETLRSLIIGGTGLTEIDGFGSLTRVSQYFWIGGNDHLTDLEGFSSLTSVDDFGVAANDALTSLDGLRNLQRLTGLVHYVQANDLLEDLDGLSGLRYINGPFFIEDNPSLQNVDGLAGLQSVGYGVEALRITNNPVLERCALGVGPLLVAGDVLKEYNVLGGNGTALEAPAESDCNSEADILAAYEEYLSTDTDAPAAAQARRLAVYPNPATDGATLAFALGQTADASLVVYDALGREVVRVADGPTSGAFEARVDTGALPAGLYVARLVAGDRTETVRFAVVR